MSEEKYRTLTVEYTGEEFRPYKKCVYKETHEGLMVSFDDAPAKLSIFIDELDMVLDWLERGGGAIHGYTWELR